MAKKKNKKISTWTLTTSSSKEHRHSRVIHKEFRSKNLNMNMEIDSYTQGRSNNTNSKKMKLFILKSTLLNMMKLISTKKQKMLTNKRKKKI